MLAHAARQNQTRRNLNRDYSDGLLDLVRKATKQTKAAADAYRAVQERRDFVRARMRAAILELGEAQAVLSRVFDDGLDDQ